MARKRKPSYSKNMLRSVTSAISGEPKKMTLIADPPPLQTTIHINTRFELQVLLSSAAGLNPGTRYGKSASIDVTPNADNTKITAAMLTVNSIFLAWKLFSRTIPKKFDLTKISLRKVALWSSIQYPGVSISLTVDNQSPYSSLSTRDTGNSKSRARCGITMPFKNWYPVKSKQKILVVDIDDASTLNSYSDISQMVNGTVLGTIQLTVSVTMTLI